MRMFQTGSKRGRDDDEEEENRPESSHTSPTTKKLRLKPAMGLQVNTTKTSLLWIYTTVHNTFRSYSLLLLVFILFKVEEEGVIEVELRDNTERPDPADSQVCEDDGYVMGMKQYLFCPVFLGTWHSTKG